MPVVTLTTEISFDVAALDDAVIKAEFNRRDAVKEWAHAHWTKGLPPEKALKDFSDDDLRDEMEGRDIDDETLAAIERVYAHLANRDIDAAMDEIHREFGFAPPSHVRAIADLISGASHAEN